MKRALTQTPFSRRDLIRMVSLLAGAAASRPLLPAWARSGPAADLSGLPALSGQVFDLDIAAAARTIDGKPGRAILVNGHLPAPLLRWRQGDEITLRVTNHLDVDTSIHWHGILLPFQMDGVPGVSFPGIKPGETFTYRFPLVQAGTYWYHSHSGLQEQLGHYGGPHRDRSAGNRPGSLRSGIRDRALGLDVHEPSTGVRETEEDERNVQLPAAYGGRFPCRCRRQRSGSSVVGAHDVGSDAHGPPRTSRMSPGRHTRISSTGHGPADNWTALFQPGERVRLRIINAAATTIFNVRIPGLPMTVVQADGLNVRPVETDEFQIGVAETYDAMIEPAQDRAYTLMAESNDRSGFARATLSPREGMAAAVPALRGRPTLTMKDMAMAHESHGGHEGHGAMDDSESGGMDHSMHRATASDTPEQRHDHRRGPGVASLAMNPSTRLGERPNGLEDAPHRVLVYTDLRSLGPANPDTRAPQREIELHLTGNMHRYMWSFDGVNFSRIDGPIVFHKDERLRLTLVNDTMMAHPLHLHGMFFDVVTGDHDHKPRKHTIVVKPGEKTLRGHHGRCGGRLGVPLPSPLSHACRDDACHIGPRPRATGMRRRARTARPSAPFSPCAPPRRRLYTLAANIGTRCGLATLGIGWVMLSSSMNAYAQQAADAYFGAAEMAAARAALMADHGEQVQSLVLMERFEYRSNDVDSHVVAEGQGWIGGDIRKFWFKAEGEYAAEEDRFAEMEIQALFSRAVSPFWDLQAGIRYDIEPGPARSYAVIGVQGLAPYWFELDAALFLSDRGRLSARLEAEYEFRLDQRLLLQPRIEVNAAFADDEALGTGGPRGSTRRRPA